MPGGRAKNFLMQEETTIPSHSNWNVVRSALVADVMRRSADFHSDSPLTVYAEIRGESMLPTLWPGDVAEIESCSPADARPGEIILAVRDTRLVLHRLLAPCSANGFILCGDSAPAADPQYPSDAFLGRLVGVVTAGRTASRPAFKPGAARCFRAIGALLCHCGPLRRLALHLHNRGRSSSPSSSNFELTAEISSVARSSR
jgi:hypothetical protein